MFRLAKEDRDWFKNIKKDFSKKSPLFDMYYICFMAGLAANQKGEAPTTGDLVDYWPDEYREYSDFIIGLILIAEAGNKGIDISTRSHAIEHLDSFIDAKHYSRLSLARGFRDANQFAKGGSTIIKQKIPQPYFLGEFLQKYQALIKEEVNKNKNFK